MKSNLVFYQWMVTATLEPSARLPEQVIKFRVQASNNYRAMLWGLQKLTAGQRRRLRAALVDGPFERAA